ncbi:MAG: PadR family transcriptional regulator [Candidatus Hodarchaeota archaeon]
MFFGKRFYGHKSGQVSGLDILVLSIIENFDGISGYDLIQEINSKFRRLWRATPGTIYPLLNQLTERGFLTIEEIMKNNRELKIYRITNEGKQKLHEVLKNNLASSMGTLGDYIRTVIQTWVPNEESINEAVSCFPFHCRPKIREIDENDCSLRNIERIERLIQDLTFSKERLSDRLEDIEQRLSHFEELVKKLKKERDENMKIIDIVDDDEYTQDF